VSAGGTVLMQGLHSFVLSALRAAVPAVPSRRPQHSNQQSSWDVALRVCVRLFGCVRLKTPIAKRVPVASSCF
jgi:hypothetical protein